jgi:DNA adenine methylase
MLAPWIIQHLPPHRIYVEPFGGAASVLLRKPRSYAEVYNDLDQDVVNLFRVLRDPDQAARLILELQLTPFARAEFAQSYAPSSDPIESARRLVVRSFMGFGSNGHARLTGFRYNANRSGTTPAHDWANYPDALAATVDRLRGVVIESRPALDLIPQHDGAETLFYVDPPYVAESRDAGRDYLHEMTDADHRALAESLSSVRGMVVLSCYPSALYESLYAGWHRVERAALADGGRKRVEVLWINRAALGAMPPPSLFEVAP